SLTVTKLNSSRYTETSLDKKLRDDRLKQMKRVTEDAQRLTLNDRDVFNSIKKILETLESLIIGPQCSLPDIFLWLMSGKKRIAYARIPPHTVLYGEQRIFQGIFSGEPHSFMLYSPDEMDDQKVVGEIKASLWLGLKSHVTSWWKERPNIKLSVFAETYENQIWVPGKSVWDSTAPDSKWPNFSDANGLVSLHKEDFAASNGGNFKEDWKIIDITSVQYNEECYEVQTRKSGQCWDAEDSTTWLDVHGCLITKEKALKEECIKDWEWKDPSWMCIFNGGVDVSGWEYSKSIIENQWSSIEYQFHTVRRRKWKRERKLKNKLPNYDGWLYGTSFNRNFHPNKEKNDSVRQRVWRRELHNVENPLPLTSRLLQINSKEGDGSKTEPVCPRLLVSSSSAYKYQLRSYIYQAKDLSEDTENLKSPYATIKFCNLKKQTHYENPNDCPVWNETMIFDDVTLEPPNVLKKYPLQIQLEVNGQIDSTKPIGTAVCSPNIVAELDHVNFKASSPQWLPLFKGNQKQGEILASFDLIIQGTSLLPDLPPIKKNSVGILQVPFEIQRETHYINEIK
ncbi:unnamed protein product, partial [Meganyctiphanes norvegica]